MEMDSAPIADSGGGAADTTRATPVAAPSVKGGATTVIAVPGQRLAAAEHAAAGPGTFSPPRFCVCCMWAIVWTGAGYGGLVHTTL
jgi:hypothetical protein